MKDQILKEIRRLAAINDGQPPGQKLFLRETGIGDHHWRGKFWVRWGDAVVEAGYKPNKWTGKLDSDEVLLGIITACRHYGRWPTLDELSLYRKTEPSIPSAQAIRRHFGGRAELAAALAEYAAGNPGHNDILPMLPDVPKPPAEGFLNPSKTPDGFVYLFKSGEFYKIGRSDDIERRIKEIRVSLPEKLTPIHSIRTDDPAGIEAYWHRRFADKRANGEWFKLTALDLAAFKKRKYQ